MDRNLACRPVRDNVVHPCSASRVGGSALANMLGCSAMNFAPRIVPRVCFVGQVVAAGCRTSESWLDDHLVAGTSILRHRVGQRPGLNRFFGSSMIDSGWSSTTSSTPRVLSSTCTVGAPTEPPLPLWRQVIVSVFLEDLQRKLFCALGVRTTPVFYLRGCVMDGMDQFARFGNSRFQMQLCSVWPMESSSRPRQCFPAG